jgi:hypothetical protein
LREEKDSLSLIGFESANARAGLSVETAYKTA